MGDLKQPESAPAFATLKDLSIECIPLNFLHRHRSLLLPVYPVPWPMISLYTQNAVGSLPAPSRCVSIYRKTTMLGSCKRTKRGAEVTHSQPSALLYMGRGWLAMDNFGPSVRRTSNIKRLGPPWSRTLRDTSGPSLTFSVRKSASSPSIFESALKTPADGLDL